MKKVILGAFFAVVSTVAMAGSSKDIESSAVVNGTIVLGKSGMVQTAVIDDAAKYGQPIADMVRKAALQWRFHPVLRNDEPVIAKASMHVRVILKKRPDGNYSARIKGATFGDSNSASTDTVHTTKPNRNILPRYPEIAIRYRVQGTVYLALRVDRSGRVVEATAEQVNMGNIAPDRVLNRYRAILAESALKAARQWTFAVPTTGPLARLDSWTVHDPINYALNMVGESPSDHIWTSYIPGPYTPAPWDQKPDMSAVDALADDGLRTEGAGPVLLTSPNHG